MKIKYDLSRLKKAIVTIVQETKKAEVEIVNKALKDVGFKAMQYTPFASPGLIQAQLYRDKIALKLAAKRLGARAGTVKRNRFGSSRLTKTGREQKFGGVTQQAINRMADKILRKAIASSRACRAGWIPGLKRIGATIRGAGRLNPAGTAMRGTGEKATLSRIAGFIQNALVTRERATRRSTGVGSIPGASEALGRAISDVASDREAHGRKKMIGNILRKHSDR